MDEILIHVSSEIVSSFFLKTISAILFKAFFNAVLADLAG